MKLWLPSLILLYLSAPLGLGQSHWPQFRGPQASGVTDGINTPIDWNIEDGTNIRWKTPILGLAHSSPIVWEDRIYVQTAHGQDNAELKVGLYGNIESVNEPGAQRWRLLALDKTTGDITWDTLALEAEPRVKRHTKATHCNSSPATDGVSIVALFGSEGLFCFDMNGTLRWKQDLGPMDSGYFRVKSAQWGFAGSPIIVGNKVIIQCDVQKNSFVAAFSLSDGSELWRTAREDVPTWSTPAVHQSATRSQVILNGWHHSGGYDLATGKELWKLKGGGDIPVPTPIIGHDHVYLTSAHGRFRPMRAIRLDADGDITPPSVGDSTDVITWAHARQGNYMQTPILVGDLLYGCNDMGILTCFNAHTGKIHYQERLERGRTGFTASPVSDGQHLYFTSEQGGVYVVPVGPEFSIKKVNQLGETCLSTPAISDGALLFRTRHHLMAVGTKKTG